MQANQRHRRADTPQTASLAGSPQPRLVSRFREARRACRPVVGDRLRKRVLADSGNTDVIVTAVGYDDVEWKRHFFHDSGTDWELDRPHASHLWHYRRLMIMSLRRGCEFIPALPDCEECEGTGQCAFAVNCGEFTPCPDCGGTGKIHPANVSDQRTARK